MNGELRFLKLRQAKCQRQSIPPEKCELHACLAENPKTRVEWEEDARLDGLLAQLQDVPISSNFTARVIHAVQQESENQTRLNLWWDRLWPTLGWARIAAVAVLMVGLGLFALHRHRLAMRFEVAESLITVTGIRSLPAHAEILKDFEAIRDRKSVV